MRSIWTTEGCGGRRGSLFPGKGIVAFLVAPSEGFWGALMCSGEEEEEEGSGFWGRVALATTMGLVMGSWRKQNMASLSLFSFT